MSKPFARSLIEVAGLNQNTVLDHGLLNRILAAIETRFRPLEGQKDAVDAAVASVRQVGLSRINEVLTPALQNIFDIQSRGFLIARAADQHALVPGDVLTFTVGDPAERALFTPSPFTAITREGTPDDYGIARTISYDGETGEYVAQLLTVGGDPGPHADWVIGALAGPTIAMRSFLEQGELARDQAVAAAAAIGDPAALTLAIAAASGAFDPDDYVRTVAGLPAPDIEAEVLRDTLGVLPFASVNEYRAAAATRALSAAVVWAAAVPVQLVDAATIAVDLGATINAKVTLAGNRTLGAPVNGKPGQTFMIEVYQDEVGARGLAYHTTYKFDGGTVPSLPTEPNARSVLHGEVYSDGTVGLFVAKEMKR